MFLVNVNAEDKKNDALHALSSSKRKFLTPIYNLEFYIGTFKIVLKLVEHKRMQVFPLNIQCQKK